VRLKNSQIATLVRATHHCFGEMSKIWLFGSRVDDSKRGGDIDIYIETDLETGIVATKLEMRSLIWKEFGDQKIDILVRSRKKELSPMHKLAKQMGVELQEGSTDQVDS